MNKSSKFLQTLYLNDIICVSCFNSQKIACDKCKQTVADHVLSGKHLQLGSNFCNICGKVLEPEEDGVKDGEEYVQVCKECSLKIPRAD